MDVKEMAAMGGRAKWAKVKSRKKRSEMMRKVRRGKKFKRPTRR